MEKEFNEYLKKKGKDPKKLSNTQTRQHFYWFNKPKPKR